MTGPWEQLKSTGTLSDDAVALVYETVDAVRRFDRFPPPPGDDEWTDTAVHEFAHEFLYGDRGPARLAKLVASAADETSFERVLEAAVRNVFREQARRTDRGAVLRALDHATSADDDVHVAGRTSTKTWSLGEHVDDLPYSGRVADLVDAAYAVPDVRRARWPATSTRRPPIAESDSLRRVIRAVLARAAAPVLAHTMLDVIVARFPSTVDETVEIDVEASAPARSGDAVVSAREVWGELTDRERLVSGVLDLPVREVADETGLSRGTAQRAVTSARRVLSEFLADVDDREGVVAELAAMSAAVRNAGTERAASASDQSEQED